MRVKEAKFAKMFARLCDDGFYQGWHERNGGNLSYRLSEKDVNQIREDLCIYSESEQDGSWKDIGTTVQELANDYFMVTGSGKYMRNVQNFLDENVCIIKLNDTGDQYQVVWGLKNGGNPTSELPSHLMNLETCRKRDPEINVVYHCHPTNIIALTYVLPLDEVVFTRELFEMATECPVVFPEGVGVVPWMVPGGKDIAVATSEIMKTKNFAIWAHHGAFACGHDFDSAFGLMHTVEKSAEVLVKVLSMTNHKRQTIDPDQFRNLAKDFKVKIDDKYLYEKTPNATIGER